MINTDGRETIPLARLASLINARPVPDCLVCAECSGGVPLRGGPLVNNELAVGFQLPVLSEATTVVIGHLMVVPRRHVPGFAETTDGEAAAVGRAIRRLSRALQRAGAERVYTATIGHGVAHLHVHVLARWPGTAEDVPWHEVNSFSGARRGTTDDAAAFVAQLREGLT